jgi:iron complex outermembrane receptor protein
VKIAYKLIAALLAGLLFDPRVSWAQDASNPVGHLSIEELLDVTVTSVGKKEQQISEAAAAIYVITQEDLHNSGVTSIPDALRRVPGLQVAQLSSYRWNVSARGFSEEWSGKLLVLVDGRTVYNPFFSGVYWDVQDLVLEDIERIEVIRGPGATLWGANAVNGVINISTKQAKDTQGGLAGGLYGNQEAYGQVRYGGRFSSNAHYRVYLKYSDHDDLVTRTGQAAGDKWDLLKGGFRTDWEPNEKNLLTLQGDLFRKHYDTRATIATAPGVMTNTSYRSRHVGANMLARWSHTFSAESSMYVQGYYDWQDNDNPLLAENHHTLDLELQHRFPLGSRQEIVWGVGYRHVWSTHEDSFFLDYATERGTSDLYNIFVQDDIWLVRDHLRLTLGSKFEHNQWTGLEIQPNARLLWRPAEDHSVWASVSRAVKTPNAADSELRVNYASFTGPVPTGRMLLAALPNPNLKSENLIAYELGYRVQAHKRLSLDVATFFNNYERLTVAEPLPPRVENTPPPPHFLVATENRNAMHGYTYGVEFAPSWKVTDFWQLSGGYTFLKMNLFADNPSNSVDNDTEGNDPTHQFHVRSFLTLPGNLSFDLAAYYVDELPSQDVPSYVRLDARLSWRPTRNLEVSVGASNLLDNQHPEFRGFSPAASEVPRAYYGKLSWSF